MTETHLGHAAGRGPGITTRVVDLLGFGMAQNLLHRQRIVGDRD